MKGTNKIDYFVFESVLARFERSVRRWMIACGVLFVALMVTNIGFLKKRAE